MRHLLSIEDLDRAAIERICDRAAAFAEVADREIKKVPALRGRTVLNLFYEAVDAHALGFELAAKRLSADVVNFAASGSSVEKGESLKDTVLTLSAHKPDAIVIRTPWAGRRRAGQPAGPRPRSSTPATASTSTRPRRCSTSTRCAAASGDIDGAERLDRRRRPALARRALEHPRLPEDGRPGDRLRPADAHPARTSRRSAARCASRSTTCGQADVVYALRMQNERMNEAFVPSLREYATVYQINGRRLSPAPDAHAPRPGQPRRRALRRGRRLAAVGHHRPGRGRGRGADGGPLRGPGRRARARPEPVPEPARLA